MPRQLKLPGTYVGGKGRAAPLVWRLLGDPDYYTEPFCGWASVFYGRPAPATGRRLRVEVIGDRDGLITNVHRAVRYDPGRLVEQAAWVGSEIDQRARQAALRASRATLADQLVADPHHYDLTLAAWVLWISTVGVSGATMISTGQTGISRTHALPRMQTALFRDTVHECSRRLDGVVLFQGDWTVLCRARYLTNPTASEAGRPVGIYLDPPYQSKGRTYYGHGDTLTSAQVRAWCVEDMAPHVRAVLSGYDDEHDELLDRGWTKHRGLARIGTGANGTEQLWASPACLDPDTPPDAPHLETP